MNIIISYTSSFVYRYLAKPVLFWMKPDRVHTLMLRTSARLQKSRIIRWLIRSSWAHEDYERLGQIVEGTWFRNPVGLSAGFDKNFEVVTMIRSIGFGFMEGGSVTHRVCEGNPRPWFHRLPHSRSLVVHVGLANHGVERITRRIMSYRPELLSDFPLNISVAQTNTKDITNEEEAIADYIGSFKYIKKAGVGQLLTINISCPNTYRGEPFTNPTMLERLLKEVDELNLEQPVFIKMPNQLQWKDFNRLLHVAARHKIRGLIISNLAKRESGLQLSDPLPESIRGGLSGKPTWERSNELIRRTYRKYGDRFVIIGVGGVFSAEDAYTKIRLGATLVELITGMIYEGPTLVGQINRDLAKLLKRDGFDNIKQAVGVDAK